MKQMLSRITVLSIILVFLLQTSCKKDTISTGSNTDANNLEINQFMWYGMHNYYLWVDNVPKLSVSQYSNETALNSFLNGYTDHEKLFNDLLYQKDVIDKWSFIIDDYTVLDSLLSGISKTNGMDFGLVLYDNVNNYVLGYVKYVAKGSPAEIAGIKRGDIFTKVNNQQITTSNYQDLLFNNDSYTLSFAQIVNHTVQPTTRTVSVTSVEFQEDPVLFDSIYSVDSHKVGYLVYNGFTPDFDLELNNVFKNFKDNGVDKLILDLRYNGGGSGQSAAYLASMIYTTDTTKILYTTSYNLSFQAYLSSLYGSGYFKTPFNQYISATETTPKTTINSLGLNQVYVLTSNNTASASELLINGLRPYMNVIMIGDTTVGKYVGSFTIKDWIDSLGNVNPNDKWAMQPIVLKASNSQGVSDFSNGLFPDYPEIENISNLIPLGDPNELFLSIALNHIRGLVTKPNREKSFTTQWKKITDSKAYKPFGNQMYFKSKPFRLVPK